MDAESTIETRCIDHEIKFAHGEGHTVFVFNNDKLLTGGSDGEVRSWSIEQKDDDEPDNFDVGSSIYSLTSSLDHFYVASDSIDVKYYELQNGEYKGSVVRSTLNIYSISLSNDHKLLAAGGGDFIIKLVNLDDHSIKQINGHQAPILSLKFDPKRKYLASSSCDGSVQIWNLNSLESVKKIDNNHKKSNDFTNSSTLCSLAWNKDGNLLAVPTDHSINFYERDQWTVKFNLKYDNFNDISICEFDSTDKYFAAANSTGILVVWNLNFKETPIAFYVNDCMITCFKFNPTNNEKLIASDKNGQLIYMNLKQDQKMMKLDKELESNKYGMIEDDFDDDFNDDFNDADFMKDLDAIDLKNSNENKEELTDPKEKFTLSKFSTATSNKKKAKIIESDDDDENSNLDNPDSDTQQSTTQHSDQQNKNFLNDLNPADFDNNLDDEEEDELIDIGALKKKYEDKINGSMNDDKKPIENDKDKLDKLEIEEHKVVNIKVKPIMQPPFKPGSTPLELENRFMVWNSIGIVSCTRTDQDNIIDVEFHNSDIFRPIHIPNTYNYTMADLNTESLILASPLIESNDNDITASILFCMNFGSWDVNKEWRYTFPDDESIEAVTLSTNFVMAATDLRKLRLFTLSGIQLHLFSIPGPVICLSAQDNLLQIIYHNGSGLPGEQSVSMNLLKLNDRSFYPLTQLGSQQQVQVSLSPKSVIEWAGFTDEGNSCIVDSAGLIKLYNLNSRCWIPIADLKSKNKNDHYFIISISEIQEQIRCISCKGAKYPSTIPKPDVFNLPFEIPLCEITTTKSKLEEQLIRTSLRKNLLEGLSKNGFDVEFPSDENRKKQVEILIKLFALAVNADCNSLAIEVASLMPTQLAIEGAIRYASQKNKKVLINKLNRLSNEKFSNCNQVDENDDSNNSRILNSKPNKKRQLEDNNDDILKPKQIKLSNDKNPFKI